MVVALTGLARSLRVRRKADAENAELRGVSSLLHGNISGAIIGAFYTVHTELGSGFLEAVYVNAMTVLLQLAGVRVDRQVPFDIRFHGQHLGTYRADLVVEDRIIVEIKAGRTIIPRNPRWLFVLLTSHQHRSAVGRKLDDLASLHPVRQQIAHTIHVEAQDFGL